MDCPFMDCCLSEAEQFKRRQNRRINKSIKDCKRKEKTIFKLLLLGTAQSGKSTFLRQMRIIYGKGFPDSEKMQFISFIREIILSSIQTMVEAMGMLNISYESEANNQNAELIQSLDIDSDAALSVACVTAIKEMWNDAGFQKCFQRRSEYQLDDCIKYYMEHLDRIAESKYLPTEADILHVRIPTTGLIEYRFMVNNCDFRMIDVGGQRSERKKWLHCFDNVKAVIFLIAISEYDQVLLETHKRNRLEESKHVFESIGKSEWFAQTSLVVFFNKMDLLLDKITFSHLADVYPSYTGPRKDYMAARDFITNMFLEAVPSRQMYKHYTCATDTENIKVVFAVVRDTILADYLKNIML